MQESRLFPFRRKRQCASNFEQIIRERACFPCVLFPAAGVPQVLLQDDPVAKRGARVFPEEGAEACHERGRVGERHGRIVRAPIGIYRTTREGKFRYANLAFARMLGYASVAEILPLDIPTEVYYEPADRERALEEYRRRGELHGFEVRLRRKDGAPLWVRFDMRLVPGAAPGSFELEGFVHDTSESRRAEAEVAKSELYYRSLIEHALDLTAVLAPDGTVLFVSPSVERLLGVRPDDAKG